METYLSNGEHRRDRPAAAHLAGLWPKVGPAVLPRQWGEGTESDRSRRPHRSPAQTLVLEAKKATGYGRKRLAWYLWRERGLALFPHTIRHILRRNGFRGRKAKREAFGPAHGA